MAVFRRQRICSSGIHLLNNRRARKRVRDSEGNDPKRARGVEVRPATATSSSRKDNIMKAGPGRGQYHPTGTPWHATKAHRTPSNMHPHNVLCILTNGPINLHLQGARVAVFEPTFMPWVQSYKCIFNKKKTSHQLRNATNATFLSFDIKSESSEKELGATPTVPPIIRIPYRLNS